MTSSTNFDPYSQNVTLLLSDGITPITFGVQDVDDWYSYAVKSRVNFATQVGACMVMFFATAFLTRESQRSKPVFILNLASLALGTLRPLLLILWATSPWSEFYSYFSGDISRVHKDTITTSVAATVIPVLMTITVNMSLVLQAQTVCKVMEKKYYYTLSALACIVLLLAVGWRFAECVTNSMAITSDYTYFSKEYITTGALVCETISIWFFSLIFTWKLFWTIMTRRKHGWANLNAMQALMIMSGCTMIIPSIFAVLEYTTIDSFPEAGTLAITMVALLLPLSSLWASMITTAQSSSFNFSSLINSRSSPNHFSARGSESACKSFGTHSTSTGLNSFRDRKGSLAPICATSIDTIVEIPARGTRDSTELDLEAMGVRVDKSYSVRSNKDGY
ncbi:Fungal pheromone mating factor STE2 GPCR domain containing protein [Hyaloscypha variabilis]